MATVSSTCIGCGQHDDHPKHQVVLPGHTSVFWHMDCHTLADPACEVCALQIAGAEGARGDDLREHLTTKDERHG